MKKKSEDVEDDCVVCGQFVSGNQLHTYRGKRYCKAHYNRKLGVRRAANTKHGYKSFQRLINSGLST